MSLKFVVLERLVRLPVHRNFTHAIVVENFERLREQEDRQAQVDEPEKISAQRYRRQHARSVLCGDENRLRRDGEVQGGRQAVLQDCVVVEDEQNEQH